MDRKTLNSQLKLSEKEFEYLLKLEEEHGSFSKLKISKTEIGYKKEVKINGIYHNITDYSKW